MESRVCAHPRCATEFVPKPKAQHQKFCSRACADNYRDNAHWIGDGLSSRIFFRPCKRCGVIVSCRAKAHDKAMCGDCRREWYRGHNARKAHARRASGAVLSVSQIAARDGEHCNICHRKVDMSLSGRAKWGPTIDHLIPVSKGGTNAPENLALAHRHCNVSRGNRGHAQLLLVS